VLPVIEGRMHAFSRPSPQFRELLATATRDQGIADLYAEGYNRPDWFWGIASSPERTAAFLRERQVKSTVPATPR